MERLWEVCQEQGLPMDVYRKKSSSVDVDAHAHAHTAQGNNHQSPTAQEELVQLTTRFNQGGNVHMTELTNT